MKLFHLSYLYLCGLFAANAVDAAVGLTATQFGQLASEHLGGGVDVEGAHLSRLQWRHLHV